MKTRGAMEMSVGTIVTIVLLMTVLILGLVLVKNIYSSASGVVDLTDQQLKSEVEKLFSQENKLVIVPSTREIEIKQEKTDGVGIGIKNLLTGTSGTKTFSYEVVVSDASDCSESAEEIETWLKLGKSEQDIPIAPGEYSAQKVLIEVPTGSSLCVFRCRVNVYVDGDSYDTDFFDVTVKAK